jgi:hypothetical protein
MYDGGVGIPVVLGANRSVGFGTYGKQFGVAPSVYWRSFQNDNDPNANTTEKNQRHQPIPLA